MLSPETSGHIPPVDGHGIAEWHCRVDHRGPISDRFKHCEGWCGSGGLQREAFRRRSCEFALSTATWDKHGRVSGSSGPCGPFQILLATSVHAPGAPAPSSPLSLCRPLGEEFHGLVLPNIRGKVLTARFCPSIFKPIPRIVFCPSCKRLHIRCNAQFSRGKNKPLPFARQEFGTEAEAGLSLQRRGGSVRV